MKKWWKKYLRYYIRAAILLPIFLFFNLLNKFSLNKPKPVFVLSYTGMLGDLVVCSSLFSEIKKSHPNHKLIFLGQEPFTLILKGNPYIDELISYKSKQLGESFLWPIKMGLQLRCLQLEYYVNLTPNFETNGIGLMANPKNQYSVSTEHETKVQSMILKSIQSLQYKYDKLAKEHYADVLKQCQVEIEELKNQLYFDGSISEVDQFFHNIDNSKKIIGVSVSSGKSFKKWPVDKWVEFINKLIDEFHAHIIFLALMLKLVKLEKLTKT